MFWMLYGSFQAIEKTLDVLYLELPLYSSHTRVMGLVLDVVRGG